MVGGSTYPHSALRGVYYYFAKQTTLNCLLNSYFYTHGVQQLSELLTKVSLGSRCSELVKEQRQQQLLCHTRDIYVILTIPKAENISWKKRWKYCKKPEIVEDQSEIVSSRCDRLTALMTLPQLWLPLQGLYKIESDNSSSWRGELLVSSWLPEFPPITEELLITGGFGGKGNQISLRAWYVDQTLVDGPTPTNIWAAQNGLGGLLKKIVHKVGGSGEEGSGSMRS